jgi:signal transduction histidine kinase/DNA-binding response OmpR family regulator
MDKSSPNPSRSSSLLKKTELDNTFKSVANSMRGLIKLIERAINKATSNSHSNLASDTTNFNKSINSNKSELSAQITNCPELRTIEHRYFHHIFLEKLSSPITQLIGLGTALEQQAGIPLEAKDLLYVLIESSREVGQVLDEYSDIQKLLDGKFSSTTQEVELKPFLRRLYKSYAHHPHYRSIQFRWEVERNIPRIVSFDEQRVNYILRNFLDTAVRNTKNNLYVTLSASFSAEIGCVTFTVSDNGAGLDPESIETILGKSSEYDTVDSGSSVGAGFGLRFARRVAEAMGGVVTVQSQIGEGTSVALSFRANEVIINNEPSELTDSAHVLFVDYSQDYRILYERQLIDGDFTSTFLSGGQEGLSALKKNPSEFNVVVLSISLPDISAAAFARQAKEAGITVPIIAVAPNVSPALLKATKDAGCTACVSREKTADQLLPLLKRHITRKPSIEISEKQTLPYQSSGTTNLEESLSTLQNEMATIDVLLNNLEWDEIKQHQIAISQTINTLNLSTFNSAIASLEQAIRAQDEAWARNSLSLLLNICQGILLGIKGANKLHDNSSSFNKPSSNNVDLHCQRKALEQVYKAIPTLNTLAEAQEWEDLSELLLSLQNSLESLGIPTLSEHLMVLEALASSGAVQEILCSISELKDHLDFYGYPY